jgi:hypothetical protein
VQGAAAGQTATQTRVRRGFLWAQGACTASCARLSSGLFEPGDNKKRKTLHRLAGWLPTNTTNTPLQACRGLCCASTITPPRPH